MVMLLIILMLKVCRSRKTILLGLYFLSPILLYLMGNLVMQVEKDKEIILVNLCHITTMVKSLYKLVESETTNLKV